MRKRIGILLSALLLTMLAMTSIACTVQAEPDAKLVIISPHQESILKEFETAFKDYYLVTYGESVEFEVLDIGGTSDIVKYIDSGFEATPEGIRIDVLWGGGVDPFIAAAEKGQLLPYRVDDEVLNKIPATFAGIPMYDSQYRWYGTALSGFGIVYNKALLQIEGLLEPTTWEDLTEPELKGWVGSADPRNSGSTHMMYEIILQGYGWEEGMKLSTLMGANIKTFPPSSSAVPKSVGAGDVAYGLAIDFYAWSEVSKVGADKIGYVMPEGLTVINPDSIAILKGAPNLEVAERFVTFVLSEKGQKLWMLPVGAEGGPRESLLGRLCVIPELFTELADVTVVPINPFEVETTLDYDPDLGSVRYSLVNDLIGAMIIDSHTDLVSTWGEIIATEAALEEAGVTSARIEEAKAKMGEVPLSEQEALTIAEQWDDAEVRNRYISEWHEFALEKYKEASNLAALARADLVAQHESELAALRAQYESLVDKLEGEKQSNLYMGLGGGVVLGAIVGFAVSYYMARQKEIAAVRA
jgi:ABC-type Fe3+ transport system substrate-binding protein